LTLVNGFINKVVEWLRAGYPEGVPQNDYIPLLALLARRLTPEEVKMVAHELGGRPYFDEIDIGAEIMRITDDLPSVADVERVRERLAGLGWPLDDPREDAAEA
jgi:Protein of unknown function (DUF3349)